MDVKRLFGGLLSLASIFGVFKAAGGGGVRVTLPINPPAEPAKSITVADIPTQGQSVSKIPYDVDILARTLCGEARSEGARGMQAVANVVMNRVRDRRWPNTAAAVCLQPYQFSCWNANDPNRAYMLRLSSGDNIFRQALNIAQEAVSGNLPDITGGANHYHTHESKPYWSKGETPIASIGGHRFFNLA